MAESAARQHMLEMHLAAVLKLALIAIQWRMLRTGCRKAVLLSIIEQRVSRSHSHNCPERIKCHGPGRKDR